MTRPPLPIIPLAYAIAIADIPVTADTITDEEIRELRSCGDHDVEVIAHAALFPAVTPSAKSAVRIARAHCAEILNARSGK